MIGALLAIAVIAAVVAVALRRREQRRAIRNRTGATLLNALRVDRFDEIDAALESHRCGWCGGVAHPIGESSHLAGERRFRIVRLVCDDCERDERVHFDVTAIFH